MPRCGSRDFSSSCSRLSSSGSSGNAFGGLLGTAVPINVAGGADAGAGGAAVIRCAEAAEGEGENSKSHKYARKPPPQPSLPVRMPRRMPRDVWAESSCGSIESSSASTSSVSSQRSLGGSASVTPLLEETPGKPQDELVVEVDVFANSPVTQHSSHERESSQNTGNASVLQHRAAKEQRHATEEQEVPRARVLSDFSDYCCFRDGRPPRRGNNNSSSSNSGGSNAHAAVAKSQCTSIREDRPETVFLRDVALLELRSLLRKHAVEPTDALVGDLLLWQAEGMRSFVKAGKSGEVTQSKK